MPTNVPQLSDQSGKFWHYHQKCHSKSLNGNNVRVIGSVYAPKNSTSIVDDALLESNTPILQDAHIPSAVTSNINDECVPNRV